MTQKVQPGDMIPQIAPVESTAGYALSVMKEFTRADGWNARMYADGDTLYYPEDYDDDYDQDDSDSGPCVLRALSRVGLTRQYYVVEFTLDTSDPNDPLPAIRIVTRPFRRLRDAKAAALMLKGAG